MATVDEIKSVLQMLSAAHPRYELTPETVQVYAALLRDIPGDDLKVAALKAGLGPFFPSAGELRDAVADIRAEAQGLPGAAEAWGEVINAKATNGRVIPNPDESSPYPWIIERGPGDKFSHPLVEEVARRLGWPDSFPNPEMLTADRAHFLKSYEKAREEALGMMSRPREVTEYIQKISAEERARLTDDQAGQYKSAVRGLIAKTGGRS